MVCIFGSPLNHLVSLEICPKLPQFISVIVVNDCKSGLLLDLLAKSLDPSCLKFAWDKENLLVFSASWLPHFISCKINLVSLAVDVPNVVFIIFRMVAMIFFVDGNGCYDALAYLFRCQCGLDLDLFAHFSFFLSGWLAINNPPLELMALGWVWPYCWLKCCFL